MTWTLPLPREKADPAGLAMATGHSGHGGLQALSDAPAPGRWQVRLLGGLELSDGQHRLNRLPSRAHVALLARLALAPQRAHAREELIELLWPGVALEIGRNRLRQVLSTLKSVLEPAPTGAEGPVLVADRTSLRVTPGALVCDVPLFEQSLRAGRHDEAARLYRGELLPGYYDAWIDDERVRLAALHDRLPDDVAPARPLAWKGQPSPPPAEPTAAGSAGSAHAVHTAQADRGPDAGPWSGLIPGLDMARHNLPHFLTPLFGVAQLQADLLALVQTRRLVSVLGPGGCGKTRLAVAVGHQAAAAEHPAAAEGRPIAAASLTGSGAPMDWQRVVFVPWVACLNIAQAVDALALALRLALPAADPLAAVVAALAGQRVLLLLDNCEQMPDVGGAVVARLLQALPLLHVLATSRRPLGVDGEQAFTLAPLLGPEQANETTGAEALNLAQTLALPAVALFVDRVRAVRPDFHLGERNRATVLALVRALEGLPLAIELAATRLRSLGLAELLARLQSEAAPRMALLSRPGTRSAVDPRHASLERVVAWSWQLLSPAAADLASRLTVMRASFGSGLATELASPGAPGRDEPPPDDPAMLLDELVSQHLLRQAGSVDDTPRFALYEPVREYAARQLSATQAQATRQRLRAWALHWVQQLPPTPSLAALRAEMPQLVAALQSAAQDGAPADAVALLMGLRGCLEDVPLPLEGLTLAQAALAQLDSPGDAPAAAANAALRASGQAVLAPLLYAAGQADAALAMAEAALTDSAPGLPRARALHSLARVRWRSLRRAQAAEPLIDEAEALEAQTPDPRLRASLLALRAFIANAAHRDLARGEALHRQALTLWQRLGNQHDVDSGRYNLAVCANNQGRHAEALRLLAPVLASAAEQQDHHRLSQALNVQGDAHVGLRDWAAAVAAYQGCLRVARQSLAPFDLAYGLWNLPRALAHVRQAQAAVQLMAFAAQYWRGHFGALGASDQLDLRRLRRLAAVQLPGPEITQLWAEGEGLSLTQACALAGLD